ncbi:MAG TPA: hypothetical protein VGM62_00180, partial [Chthoniobacterales bacterium]
LRWINSGPKRAVAWANTFLQNFADGFFFGATGSGSSTVCSDYNSIDGATVGHDNTIADASAFRGGIVVDCGDYNNVRNLTVYNGSRAVHLENDVTTETVTHNKFENVRIPAIGDMDYSLVILMATSVDHFGDNDFVNFQSLKSRANATGTSIATSVQENAFTSAVFDDHFLSIRDSVFPTSVYLTGTKNLLSNVTAATIYTPSPNALTFSEIDHATVQNMNIVVARGDTIKNSRFSAAGSVFGFSGSTMGSLDELNRFQNNRFIVSDLSTADMLKFTAPALLDGNLFDYEGSGTGTFGAVLVNSVLQYGGVNIPMLAHGNVFFAKTAAAAYGFQLKSGASYVPDRTNIQIGVTSTSGLYYEVSANAVAGTGSTLTQVSAGNSQPAQKVTNTSGTLIYSVDNAGNVTTAPIKSTTGQRYVCVDVNGKLVSSATACSGT